MLVETQPNDHGLAKSMASIPYFRRGKVLLFTQHNSNQTTIIEPTLRLLHFMLDFSLTQADIEQLTLKLAGLAREAAKISPVVSTSSGL